MNDTSPTDATASQEPVASAPVASASRPRPATGAHAAVRVVPQNGWLTIARALRPQWSASQVLLAVLCAALGFSLALQWGHGGRGELMSLRQGDLIRLLDDVTRQSQELEDQVADLHDTREELAIAADRQRTALELAERQAVVQGILSGRLPAAGPGVTIQIEGPVAPSAATMVNVLEELRNAGAEVVEVNDVRLVASSYFTGNAESLVVDGTALSVPIKVTAIGDPQTIATALKIHGGAIASLERAGSVATVANHEQVRIDSTVEPVAPRYMAPTD